MDLDGAILHMEMVARGINFYVWLSRIKPTFLSVDILNCDDMLWSSPSPYIFVAALDAAMMTVMRPEQLAG
jgi:hypothetical protein